jgi:hypothetical protein
LVTGRTVVGGGGDAKDNGGAKDSGSWESFIVSPVGNLRSSRAEEAELPGGRERGEGAIGW